VWLPARPWPIRDLLGTASAWGFLLGQTRCDELCRLAGRLTAYLSPYTPAAVAGSLQAWTQVAASAPWRQTNDAHGSLYQQQRRWYELVILLQDPSTLIQPNAAFRHLAGLWRGLRAFWLQIVLGIGSLVLMAVFVQLASSSGKSGFEKSLFAILSVVGVSATTVTAKLKNAAQAVTMRIKQDIYTDLVSVAIAIIPAKPGALVGGQRRDLAVRRAVHKRPITPGAATPA
jgi:hypothetical protein